MNIPDLTVLVQKIKTTKEVSKLAEQILTDYGLRKLGPNAKKADIGSAIIKRAKSNKKIHQQLQNYLYENVEITATGTQELLGINSYFRQKLVECGILISTSEKKNAKGKGMVHYFSYANILRCVHNSRYEEMKEEYYKKHEKNVERLEKINKVNPVNVKQEIDEFDVRVKKVDPETLYRRALDSKSSNNRKYHPSDYSTYCNLTFAPEEDRNRWIDNFIRHRLTNYDQLNHCLEGQYFVDNVYEKIIPEKFTEEIRKVYPFYKRNTYVAEYGKKDPTK